MKHKHIAKRYWEDKTTAMGYSEVLAKSFDDVIDLSLGDPDMITDGRIIDLAAEDAHKGHTKYTDARGDHELRDEIRKFYKDEYGMELKDEEVFVTTSANHAMYLALETVVDEGDEVIIQGPYYPPYPQQVELVKGVPVELPTYEDEGFQINSERLESIITDKTRAIIMNTPNNPTGCCLSMDSLEMIAAAAKKHDLIVIADDIYTAFTYQTPFVPIASLPGMFERTITMNSFSKDFTMTGWRVGDIVAPTHFVEVMQQINENVVFAAPSVSQRAALYALKERNRIQPPMVSEFRKRVYYAAERIERIPWMSTIYPPKGTFYLFINIKKTQITSKEISDLILREAHVLTLPGDTFGECGEGYIRIACTVNSELIGEAFDRIEKMDIDA